MGRPNHRTPEAGLIEGAVWLPTRESPGNYFLVKLQREPLGFSGDCCLDWFQSQVQTYPPQRNFLNQVPSCRISSDTSFGRGGKETVVSWKYH